MGEGSGRFIRPRPTLAPALPAPAKGRGWGCPDLPPYLAFASALTALSLTHPTLPSYPRTLRTLRPGLSEPPLPPLQKKRRRGLFHFRRPRSFKGDRGPGSPTTGLLLPPPPPPPPTQESPPSPDPPSLGNNSSPCWSPEEESGPLPGFGGSRGPSFRRKMVSEMKCCILLGCCSAHSPPMYPPQAVNGRRLGLRILGSFGHPNGPLPPHPRPTP